MPLKESAHSESGRILHDEAILLGLQAAYLSNKAYDELRAAKDLRESVSLAGELVQSVNLLASKRGMDEIVELSTMTRNTVQAKLQEENAQLRFEQFRDIAGIIFSESLSLEIYYKLKTNS